VCRLDRVAFVVYVVDYVVVVFIKPRVVMDRFATDATVLEAASFHLLWANDSVGKNSTDFFQSTVCWRRRARRRRRRARRRRRRRRIALVAGLLALIPLRIRVRLLALRLLADEVWEFWVHLVKARRRGRRRRGRRRGWWGRWRRRRFGFGFGFGFGAARQPRVALTVDALGMCGDAAVADYSIWMAVDPVGVALFLAVQDLIRVP